ncbi:hypothetical protein HPB48_004401 [Haemaphysalis longicornis]|uniref:Uncharacterized protein n=1 Tax=Haemaphysalis longicornis TaxID=44386 RepID=A0A9J6FRP4_HAELO|nr:hypothetical protein HPB48_004401 [Haemaphysalis longicornis]
MEKELVWNLSDGQGNSLWHVCAARNHLRCFQWLCQGHPQHVLADENHSNLTPVATAVKHGNLEILQWLVSKSWALDQIDPSEGNRTLLHLAAKYGQERTVRWLAGYMQDNRLNINRKDSDGNTAMHLAARYGHITVIKNEQGMRPYGVALQSSQESCADYLLTVEVCLGLSAEQVLLEGHFQSLQAENTEVKNGFKELLVLTRRLLRRQEEMLQYVQAVCSGNSDRAESDSASALPWDPHSGPLESKQTQAKLQALLENTQLKLLPEEESRLLQLEEKWRRLRVNKGAIETRSPMELLRSQFAQVLAKCSTPPVQPVRPASSSSSTSASNESGDDESAGGEPNTFSAPAADKHPSSNRMPWEQEVCSWDKVQVFLDGLCDKQATPKKNKTSNTLVIRHGASRARAKDQRESLESAPENVSLKVLFENNPELRQEGQTCSVLEVLEPSSSDAEDDLHQDSCGSSSGSFRSNENAVLHVAERRQPRQVKGDCQQWSSMAGVPKEGGGRARAIFLTNIAELPDCSSGYKLSVKFQQSQECSHATSVPEVASKEEVTASDGKSKSPEKQMSFAEPDLIRGTSIAERCPLEVSSANTASPDVAARESVGLDEEETKEQYSTADAVACENTASAADASPPSVTGAKKRSGFLPQIFSQEPFSVQAKTTAAAAAQVRRDQPRGISRNIHAQLRCRLVKCSEQQRCAI